MERLTKIYVVDSNYIKLSPRAVNGKWVIGFIKKQEKENAQKAFEFLWCKFAGIKNCQDKKEVLEEVDLETAAKQAQEKFNIPIRLEECHERFSTKAIPTINIYVGEEDAYAKTVNPEKADIEKAKKRETVKKHQIKKGSR